MSDTPSVIAGSVSENMVSLVEEEISSGTPTTYKPTPATIDPQSFHPIYKVYFVPPVGVISKCPPNSRLFIGNLAVERVDAKDIASVFVAYGNIMEISIKSSFGFVQFDSADACAQAIANEQGRLMGGLKLGKCRVIDPKI
jgi:RNA recognition motif-containing protein